MTIHKKMTLLALTEVKSVDDPMTMTMTNQLTGLQLILQPEYKVALSTE